MTATKSPRSPRSDARGHGTPRVAFFSAEWCLGDSINLGGSDYWRLGLPASKLYEHDWDVVFARNLGETKNGRLVVQDPNGAWRDDRDVIVLQRWMGEGCAERILRAREAGQIVINEVDDDYWNFPDSHVAQQVTDAENSPGYNREHYRESIAASSLITVSTPYLADQLSDWGPPVELVRNYIDCDWWKLLPPGDYVGWVGGLAWRGNDLELLRDTAIPWMRDRKMFFYHGGAMPAYRIEDRIGYDRVTSAPICGLPNYPKLWEPLRICLAPMEDSVFNRSKSWVKGLEACARGVPFIVSDHAEYRALGAGRIVEKPEDWVRHLEELVDPEVYAAEVAANHERVRDLDINRHWSEWATILREVVEIRS